MNILIMILYLYTQVVFTLNEILSERKRQQRLKKLKRILQDGERLAK